MAERNSPIASSIQAEVAPEGVFPSTSHELQINIVPRGYVTWEGSRAQIEAEGIVLTIPVWPERANSAAWCADGFDYWLRRCRPTGMKGPKRL